MAPSVAKVLVASVGLICGAQAALAEPPGKSQESRGNDVSFVLCIVSRRRRRAWNVC